MGEFLSIIFLLFLLQTKYLGIATVGEGQRQDKAADAKPTTIAQTEFVQDANVISCECEM